MLGEALACAVAGLRGEGFGGEGVAGWVGGLGAGAGIDSGMWRGGGGFGVGWSFFGSLGIVTDARFWW